MSGSKMSFVSVVFESEVPLLRLQARSMAIYLPHEEVAELVIIDNTRRGLPTIEVQMLLKEYAGLAPNVRFVRPQDICDVPKTIGWRSQQILKLCVASQISTDNYVVLDAKHHFIARASSEFFVTAEGRPRVAAYGFGSHPLRASLENTLVYCHLDPGPHIDRFTTTAPPFVFETKLVLEMIADIERSSGRTFGEEFVDNELTEFFLYSAWLISQGRSLDEVFDLAGTSCQVLWPGSATPSGVVSAIARIVESDWPLFGVHRKALGKLNEHGRVNLADFWVQKFLFESRGEALEFILEFERRLRRESRSKRLREAPIRLRARVRKLAKKAGAVHRGNS